MLEKSTIGIVNVSQNINLINVHIMQLPVLLHIISEHLASEMMISLFPHSTTIYTPCLVFTDIIYYIYLDHSDVLI